MEEIKKKTYDSTYDPMVAQSSKSRNVIESNLTKISKKDLPNNRLRNWNIYLSDRIINHGVDSGRPVCYISKDELSKGDSYIGERLNDIDVYTDIKSLGKGKGTTRPNNLKEYPIVIIAAKFENIEKSTEVEEYINDIFLDITDYHPLSIDINVNYQVDFISVDIKVDDDKSILFNNYFDDKINELSNRVVSYLKSDKLGDFEYYINFVVSESYYKGDKGRFGDLKKYIIKNDRGRITKVYNSYTDSYDDFIDIGSISQLGHNDLYRITPKDIKDMLSDLENFRTRRVPHKSKVQSDTNPFGAKSIFISFKKLK